MPANASIQCTAAHPGPTQLRLSLHAALRDIVHCFVQKFSGNYTQCQKNYDHNVVVSSQAVHTTSASVLSGWFYVRCKLLPTLCLWHSLPQVLTE